MKKSGEEGRISEMLAAGYLEGRGLVAVEKNFRCRLGEIDLLMLDGKTLVFVEVRKRAADFHGSAAESVSGKKRKRIIAAAKYYLMLHPTRRECRFDVVAIDGENLTWIKGAFGEEG